MFTHSDPFQDANAFITLGIIIKVFLYARDASERKENQRPIREDDFERLHSWPFPDPWTGTGPSGPMLGGVVRMKEPSLSPSCSLTRP